VHQPVSRGLAVFADAWLSGWLAEISADLRETVAHQRWCHDDALYKSTTLLYFTVDAISAESLSISCSLQGWGLVHENHASATEPGITDWNRNAGICLSETSKVSDKQVPELVYQKPYWFLINMFLRFGFSQWFQALLHWRGFHGPDLNPVDYGIWTVIQEGVYQKQEGSSCIANKLWLLTEWHIIYHKVG